MELLYWGQDGGIIWSCELLFCGWWVHKNANIFKALAHEYMHLRPSQYKGIYRCCLVSRRILSTRQDLKWEFPQIEWLHFHWNGHQFQHVTANAHRMAQPKWRNNMNLIKAIMTTTRMMIMDDNDVIKWKHFRVTGHLCREFTSHRWITRTKANNAELWCFLWSAPV